MVFAGAAAATARTGTVASSPPSSLPAFTAAASSLALSLLSNARVWHAAFSTAAIALGSMVVNDYFDVRNDRINAPSKPLPSGRVPLDGALLFGGALYLAALVAAAWLEPRELRLLVASSAAVTLAYTPVLKKVPLAKTAAVAGVIALSPAAGALAAAATAATTSAAAAASSPSFSSSLAASSSAPLAAVAPACWLAFFAVSGRELLMDAADARGDGAAGVATLPVLVGRRATLAVATACEALAAAVLWSRAVMAFAAAAGSRQGDLSICIMLIAVVALGAALVLPAARAAREALKLGRLRKRNSSALSSCSSLIVEAEAAVSSAISEAVNTMMRPMGLAVVAALVLG